MSVNDGGADSDFSATAGPSDTPASVPATQPSTPDANPAPSPGPDAKPSLREVVHQAITPASSGDESTASTPTSSKQPVSGASSAPAARKEEPPEPTGPVTPEELSRYSKGARRRIEKLTSEVRDLTRVAQGLQVRAQTTLDLQAFLQANDIGKDDFGLLLDIASALRRGDYMSFLQMVAPYVKQAQEALGIVLPEDLQQAVSAGHMKEDAARYVAQQRSARLLADTQLQRVTEQNQVTEAQRQQAEFTRTVEQAVQAWEAQMRKNDPDYARKEPVVQDLVHAVIAERGPPRSPKEAVEIASQAYARANAMLGKLIPTPRPTPRVPSSLTRVNGAQPAPTSLKEVVKQVLAR